MAIRPKAKPKPEEYVQEIEGLILRQFPDAQFEVYRVKPREYRIHVFGNFDNMFDVLDLVSERATDILVDHDIYIGVSPIGRRGTN